MKLLFLTTTKRPRGIFIWAFVQWLLAQERWGPPSHSGWAPNKSSSFLPLLLINLENWSLCQLPRNYLLYTSIIVFLFTILWPTWICKHKISMIRKIFISSLHNYIHFGLLLAIHFGWPDHVMHDTHLLVKNKRIQLSCSH